MKFHSHFRTTPETFMAAAALFLVLSVALSSAAEGPKADSSANNPHDVQKHRGPFGKFVGEWTLKDDNWTQNWGNGIDHIKILHHHTLSKEVNTDDSLLSVVDGRNQGHIFWTYNEAKKEVRHLSSFEPTRIGVGKGTLNENGDLTLKVAFEGEPEGTYRIYTYKWISEDEYELMSIQYDSQDKPTGNFYGGTFIRIHQNESYERDVASIRSILKTIDDNSADMATKLSVYADDVIHMAPNNGVINSKAELGKHLEETLKHGYADMTHEIVEVSPFDEIVLMRGQVVGTYHPKDGSKPFPFRTKNLFVFRRQADRSLKIWQVIFNPSAN
jgi:ketosteroid isomerase-like protein